MFSEKSYGVLERRAREAFVEKRIPMKRGDLGLAVLGDRYVVANNEAGCCITAAVALGAETLPDSEAPMDDPYDIAAHRLGVKWTDINALWMVWDYLMAPQRSIPVSPKDYELRDRVKAILDRLVESGAKYSTKNNDD